MFLKVKLINLFLKNGSVNTNEVFVLHVKLIFWVFVCLYVYVYVCVCMCVYVHVGIHECMYVSV